MDIGNFNKKLAEKIKEREINPYPPWRFLLKNYIIWVFGLIALLISAAAVSIMIYFMKYGGWELQAEASKNLENFFLLTLPYFWIIFLGIFIFILYYNLQRTRRGYRYPVWQIVLASVVISIILGFGFFSIGLSPKIDDILGEQAPFYSTVINRQLIFWSNPEAGRLVGVVSSQNLDHSFNIIDLDGNNWQIFIPESNFLVNSLEIGQPVYLIGQSLTNGKFTDGKLNEFQAIMIKTVHSGRSFFSRPQFYSHFHHIP